MMRRCLCLILVMLTVFSSVALAGGAETRVYRKLIALQEQYPEGTSWSSGKAYDWAGGIYSTGYGCVSFSFMLSDIAFGDLPARQVSDFHYDELMVGDILRTNNNTHTVVILEIDADGVVVVEGSYNESVHWGRFISQEEVMQSSWVLTRYPGGDCAV